MTKMIVALCAGLVLVAAPAIGAAEEVAPAAVAPPATPPPASSPFAAAPAHGPLPAASSPFAATPAYGPPAPPLLGDRNYRSPGLAVALSLQPLPIDFGNLYAENLGWGIAYSAIEVSLLAPMMWMTGQHMNHGAGNDSDWSGMETGAMMGFVSGYVLVKVVSGVHAGYAARSFNESYAPRGMALLAPVREGGLLVWSGRL